jgi:hypothetical protein
MHITRMHQDTPNAVNVIKEGAFNSCSQLRIVTLGHGQREIGVKAFSRCTSLVRTKIPIRR